MRRGSGQLSQHEASREVEDFKPSEDSEDAEESAVHQYQEEVKQPNS